MGVKKEQAEQTRENILKAGLKAGEKIVTSSIKAVTDGMKVRIGNYAGENSS